MKIISGLRERVAEWRRVLKITRKPDREEFSMSAKVTGIGILIIGTIGFLIYSGSTLIQILMRGSGGN